METPAPSVQPAATPSSPSQPPRAPGTDIPSPRRGRGNRGPSRPGRGSHGRGRGRGRGDGDGEPQQHSRHRRLSSASQNIDPTKPLLSPRNRSTSQSANPTSSTPDAQNETAPGGIDNPTSPPEDEEICFICASPVSHYSVAPCNHVTCHICSLRLRALYKTKACAHCRSNAEFVIFTDQGDKRFDEFSDATITKTDSSLGIKYEKNEIFEDTVLLLRYNCPDPSCDIACYGWPDLHRHVKNTHHRVMCDLCTRNKKVFTHEHELFTQATLRKHEKYGDDNPGAVDQSGFKGHPECGFCRQRFYGDDELYTHCRDKHERCHICDRLQTSRQQQYYLDYSQLEIHFRKGHFLCPDQECLDKKFVVFESEMDLKAHQLEVHPNGLSKDARRDARRVDMSDFDYRPAHQEARGGRRDGRGGRGRGRDPNADAPLPVSSAQPLRRDELAYQRQLAIHSAQSVSNRTFGGQLSSSADTYAARAPAAAGEPATVTATPGNLVRPAVSAPENPTPPSLDSLNIDNSSRSLSPASRARALRHSSVLERASNLLGNDNPSMTSFRNFISQYRASSITATQLIESFFNLFDSTNTSSNDLGTLIKELADIFEIPGKKEDLLKAWNDWRAIHEDYPSLPGPDGGSASQNAGSGGKRILKLKSSTAQSNKNATNRPGTWGSVAGSTPSAAPGVRSGMAFPPMPASSSTRSNQTKPAWLASGSSATASRPSPIISSSSSSARPTPTASTARPAADAFPALPAAQKPAMNAVRPGYSGNPRLQRNGGSSTAANAWGSGSIPSNGELAAVEASLAEEDDGLAAGKGRGKGKGKKVFMHWG